MLTGRDAAHKRIQDMLAKGEPLPVDFTNRVIYYVGPVDPVRDEVVGPAGPTTATRMDKFTEMMLGQTGLIAMIGKAERGPAAIEAIRKHKSAYLMGVGGAAYLVSKAIKQAKVVGFADLGMEAIYEFDVMDMPVTVAVDSNGTSVHETGPARVEGAHRRTSRSPWREPIALAMSADATPLLRQRGGHARVTNEELFFDLIYAFAVTQLSHRLLEQLTLVNALQTLVLWFAVWLGWQYTCWVTNWFNPEHPRIRLMLFALMLVGLALSATIPAAFAEAGLAFGCCFAAIQVGRSLVVLASLPRATRWCRTSVASWSGSASRRRFGSPAALSRASPASASGSPPCCVNTSRRWSASRCPASAARRPPNGRSKAATSPSATSCS